MVFDGFNWQIEISRDEDPVLAIYRAKDNTIYYSLEQTADFGTFEQTKKGDFVYNSLLANIPTEQQPAAPIKHIIELNNAIYFLSSDKIIEKKNNAFKTYSPINSFNIRGLAIGNHVFFTDLDNQIEVIENGVLVPVKGTEELAKNKAFFSYKIRNNVYAIGFRNVGIYLAYYDSIKPSNTVFKKVNAPCDAELIESEIINGTLLNDGNFVFTSNKKGAFLIDTTLSIIYRFNTKSGLYEDNIKAVMQDMNGNLWLPNYYGISYVEINSPLLKYGRQNGISGLLTSTCYYKGDLYVGTDKGLQIFNKETNLFEELLNFKKQIWFLLNYNNLLFISTTKGIYVFDGKTIKQISEAYSSFLFNDPFQNNVIYAATLVGVDVYHLSGTELNYIKTYELGDEVKTITSDYNKNIYFSTSFNGIYYLNYANSYLIDSLKKQDGLPDDKRENFVFNYKNNLLIGTGDGIYGVSKASNKRLFCKPDPTFYSFTKNDEIFRALELNGDLLCSQNEKLEDYDKYETKYVYFKNVNEKIIEDNNGIGKLKNVKPNLITYDSIQKVILISADEGLYLLHQSKTVYQQRYHLFLSTMINNNSDTLLLNTSSATDFSQFKLATPYKDNNLDFKFGYTCYENQEAIEFSYYLEGKDEAAGKWVKKNEVNYNNLFEGNYTLHVKVRNISSKEIIEMIIPFSIIAPWYRSVFAYIIYGILIILIIYFIVKLNTKRLKAQNIKLEGVIKQRTAIIEEQVHLLEHQKKEITDSINYAKGIQASILPDVKQIEKNWKDTFVFFQPKDIVSGDFYWYKNINEDEFLIACADCTGHGVPGGFMSMICSDKLHDAAKLSAEPAKILFATNNGVKTTLKQEIQVEGKSKDGMEVCLLHVNTRTQIVKYSGANRLLWIIDGVTKELREIKPTKASIASFTEFNFEYEQHDFQLKKGDLLYATTDGFPDQFGGADEKKYMSKNMKNFILSICEKPIDEQALLLKTEINNWMVNTEQVDDLLVIGIRL